MSFPKVLPFAALLLACTALAGVYAFFAFICALEAMR